MNARGMIKWAATGYGVTLGTFICTEIIMRMDGVSSGNVLAHFAMFMITQFYPLFAIILVLLPYSIFTKRWHAILGACLGNFAFLPITLGLAGFWSLFVRSPISAWQEGRPTAGIVLILAYCTLAFILTRYWLRRKRSQQSGGEVRS